MEFEQLQQVWDNQNKQPLFVFNEHALHSRILKKKTKGVRITNFSELICIVANGAVGMFFLSVNLARLSGNISMYLLSCWMLLVAVYCLISRVKRLRNNKIYDRSLRGDLSYAISLATYQVRFSSLMRWNVIPIAALIFAAGIENGKSIWIGIGTLVFLLVVSYASRWEHDYYKRRRAELEMLRGKLDDDNGEQI